MKKIFLKGNSYNAKCLYGIGVSSKSAIFLKHKEKLVFGKGFIVVWFENSPPRYYGTGENQEIIMYYYNPDDGNDEIIFDDARIQETWEKVFVLMYDEGGACFLIANRNLLLDVGAYCDLCGASRVDDVKSCALNQAGLYSAELLARVRNLERMSESLDEKGAFLEVADER